MNHKNIDTARKGQEVCIKIEPIPGDAPKMFGRHFEETDMLVSKVSVSLYYHLNNLVCNLMIYEIPFLIYSFKLCCV